MSLASLRTFDFVPPSGGQPAPSIANEQIKESVKTDLEKIGVTPAPPNERPDFLVGYNSSVFNVVTGSQSSVGVGFGGFSGVGFGVGAGVPLGSASTGRQGSLVLSFIDPQKNREIWHSTATASLNGSNKDVEKIQKAVQKMVDEFKDAREAEKK